MLDINQTKALLQWYVDMGVDEAVASTPTDWTALVEAPITTPSASSPRQIDTPAVKSADIHAIMAPTLPMAAVPAAASASLAANVAEARAQADAATTLAQLEAAVRAFEGCELKKLAKNTVFSDGNPDSDIMFIGEAPGADEDIQGIPFCGVSGKLLDEMMASIGLSRSKNAYITNTLFWRPPGNRTPTPDENALCLPFVEKHIALFNPKLLILVGGTATKALLNENAGITRLRSKSLSYTNQYLGREVPVRALFHPSYLLRQSAHKALAWQDLLAISELLNN